MNLRRMARMKPGFLRRNDPRLSESHFGLNGLDRALERHVDFDGGFFIEAGANDGITQSNTLHYERWRGWQGLLIEPIPALAWRCRTVRPRSLTVNVALGTFAQRGTTVDITYVNLMSVVAGAMPQADEQAHINSGAAVQNVKPYRLKVPCVPLSDLIDRYGIGRIDLFSLDVEGYEEQALQGLDYTRHVPRFMLIEARFRDRIENVLHEHYECVAELNERDVLFRSRIDRTQKVSVGWRYDAARNVGNGLALAGLYVD
jgi:FkbM family methyltransferase